MVWVAWVLSDKSIQLTRAHLLADTLCQQLLD